MQTSTRPESPPLFTTWRCGSSRVLSQPRISPTGVEQFCFSKFKAASLLSEGFKKKLSRTFLFLATGRNLVCSLKSNVLTRCFTLSLWRPPLQRNQDLLTLHHFFGDGVFFKPSLPSLRGNLLEVSRCVSVGQILSFVFWIVFLCACEWAVYAYRLKLPLEGQSVLNWTECNWEQWVCLY